jgi:hypothetical protein
LYNIFTFVVRLAKATGKDASLDLEVEVVDSWLPKDWKMPKNDRVVQEMSDDDNSKQKKKLHMKYAGGDENPGLRKARKPVRYRFVEVLDEAEVKEEGKSRKRKRSSLDDFDTGPGKKKVKKETEYRQAKGENHDPDSDNYLEIVNPKAEKDSKEVKSERRGREKDNNPPEIIEIDEPRRYLYGRWMRADNNLDYSMDYDSDDLEDGDFNAGLCSDSESFGTVDDELSENYPDGIKTTISNDNEDEMEEDEYEFDDRRVNAQEYDSDYEGPEEDGRIYRLLNPEEGQLLQVNLYFCFSDYFFDVSSYFVPSLPTRPLPKQLSAASTSFLFPFIPL